MVLQSFLDQVNRSMERLDNSVGRVSEKLDAALVAGAGYNERLNSQAASIEQIRTAQAKAYESLEVRIGTATAELKEDLEAIRERQNWTARTVASEVLKFGSGLGIGLLIWWATTKP